MTGTLTQMEKGLSAFLKDLRKQRASSTAYYNQAEQAEYQAALVAAEAEKQNNYLLQSAAEKARQTYQNYLQTQATQQAQTAYSGLRGDSATVQYMRKNSRFQTLLQEQQLADQLQLSVYENNEAAAEQIRALKALAAQKRRRGGKLSVGSVLTKFLGGF